MRKSITVLTAVLAVAIAGTAIAAVTFDSSSGKGFVGKGDVQLIYGWNNKALNENAENVRFRVESTEVTEVSWECTNANNQKVQEREQTTTRTIQGIVTKVHRDNKKQITGFILDGYAAGSQSSATTDGPPINSCPNANGTWSLTSPAGDPVVVSSSGGGLEVSIDGTNWTALQ